MRRAAVSGQMGGMTSKEKLEEVYGKVDLEALDALAKGGHRISYLAALYLQCEDFPARHDCFGLFVYNSKVSCILSLRD